MFSSIITTVFRVRNGAGQFWDGRTVTGFGSEIAEFHSREEAFTLISNAIRLARKADTIPTGIEIVEFELVRNELGVEIFDIEKSTAMFQNRLRAFFWNRQGLKISKAERSIAFGLEAGWTPCALAVLDMATQRAFEADHSPLTEEDYVTVSEIVALRTEAAIFVVRAKWPRAAIFDLTDFWKHMEEIGAHIPVKS